MLLLRADNRRAGSLCVGEAVVGAAA
eukprot:SAG11_NODE_8969_length_958_cov_1.038417_3_plen_26_part_01